MSEFSTGTPGNPRPGVVFERNEQGERVILNPDITLTVEKDGEARTYRPSFEEWDQLAVDCFDTLTQWCDAKLGPVGLRIAENYELRLMERRRWRSDLAC